MFKKHNLRNAINKNRKGRRRGNLLCQNNIWPVVGTQQILLIELIKIKITVILLNPLQPLVCFLIKYWRNFNFIGLTTNAPRSYYESSGKKQIFGSPKRCITHVLKYCARPKAVDSNVTRKSKTGFTFSK